MSINYEWIVTRLEAVDKDGLKNVAIQACFDVKGTEDNKEGFAQGDVMLIAPDPKKFTSISNVTHEQAIQWVKDALGDRVAEFEKRIEGQIEYLKTPQPKAVDMPWMAKEEPQTQE